MYAAQASISVGVILAVLAVAAIAAYLLCWRRRKPAAPTPNGAEQAVPQDSKVRAASRGNVGAGAENALRPFQAGTRLYVLGSELKHPCGCLARS